MFRGDALCGQYTAVTSAQLSLVGTTVTLTGIDVVDGNETRSASDGLAPKEIVSGVQGKPRLKKGTRKGRYIMRFVVASEVFELFPGLKLPVAVAEGVHPPAYSKDIE